MSQGANSVSANLQAAVIASIVSQRRFEPHVQPLRPNPQDMRDLDRLLGQTVDGSILSSAESDLSNDIGGILSPGKAESKRGHGEGGNNGGEATGKYGMLDRLLMLVALLFSGGMRGANQPPPSDEAPTPAPGSKRKREPSPTEDRAFSKFESTDKRP